MTSEKLIEHMKITPRPRTRKLYIKADASAPFRDVTKALDAARIDLFESAVLLTAQSKPVASGKIVSPRGLQVSIGPESSAGAEVVDVVSAGQELPTLKLDGQKIERNALKTSLAERWPPSSVRSVLIKADRQVEYADVVHVIDVCSALRARVILSKQD